MKFKYIVNKNYESINQILVSEFNLSTRLMNKLIKNKKIYLNDNIVDTRIAPSIGDTIAIDLNYEEDNLNIIYKSN